MQILQIANGFLTPEVIGLSRKGMALWIRSLRPSVSQVGISPRVYIITKLQGCAGHHQASLAAAQGQGELGVLEALC